MLQRIFCLQLDCPFSGYWCNSLPQDLMSLCKCTLSKKPSQTMLSIAVFLSLTLSCMHAQSLQSCPTLRSPLGVALQVPQSMGLSRQEYWKGLPFPSPGDLPKPGIKPGSPATPALAGRLFTTVPPGEPTNIMDLSMLVSLVSLV